MIHYLVNNTPFYNPYLAHHESFKSGKPVELYCNDTEYDLLDWTQEPEQSFEELMDLHAINLRNKYERLILPWSGGTDSQTIYNVFKRNNIHIDEILIRYSANSSSPNPKEHVDWIIKNHWDTTTVITPFDEYDKNIRQSQFNDDEWIFKNYGNIHNKYYVSAGGGPEMNFLCEKNHGEHNWGAVIGLEKPFVSYRNGRWYAQQRDQLLLPAMGRPRVECFFLDPVLHLKQNHMAKRVLKKFKNPVSESRYNGYYSSNPDAYRLWCQLIGRHDELTRGSSAHQKQSVIRIHNFIFDPTANIDTMDRTLMEPGLVQHIQNQDTTALNFIKGWHNLASEREFYRHLNENCFEKPNQILKFKSTWSKEYDLGP